ncbi:MAG: DUF952 domain-containing protein [Pseudomonadota bacterium]|uniref:DUF952 domain-containing protein n=1 Tax=Novosphingobium sp. MBES04 TaxID=1206458 RepID=UPI00057E7A34|nr:DUF952 domain-containing protein [Novosphingobium sp. MBES04]MED5545343.1 DUF952 domain-containing protein [Pseudomonadota bacterium]GAM06663.1 hypothetical conserved protein [Novosphingobium sp. MBES04]
MNSGPATTGVAYKILTAPQMETLLRDQAFTGAPIDVADGYIHLSDAGQVNETLVKHFAGQDDLHLVAVNLDTLEGAIRWEVSRGGALFPHLYGELPMSAVMAYAPVSRDPDGELILPA